MDDRITRLRHREVEGELGRLDDAPPPLTTRLVQTTTITSYPGTSGAYFAVNPIMPGGTESEGSAGSYTTGTAVFYAALFFEGTAPPQGTKLIVSLCGSRWVGRYDG